jgi:hypothetical protein
VLILIKIIVLVVCALLLLEYLVKKDVYLL